MPTWPSDARYQDFTSGVPVPSAALNEMQDADLAAIGTQKVMVTSVVSGLGAGDALGWKRHYLDPVNQGWKALVNNVPLFAVVHARPAARLKKIEVKYYSASGVDLGAFDLYKIDHQFDAPTTAPSQSLLATVSAVDAGWQVLTLAPGAADDLTPEHSYLVTLSGLVDDYCSAIRAEFERYNTPP